MITAKNYAAQAEVGMAKYAAKFPHDEFKIDTARIKLLCNIVKHSVHFAIPDYGRIFDDDLKGIRGGTVRLPYPNITVEYHVPEHNDPKGSFTTSFKKRIVIATEVSGIIAREYLKTHFKGDYNFIADTDLYIGVRWAGVPDEEEFKKSGMWVPGAGELFVPSRWDNVDYSIQLLPGSNADSGKGTKFPCTHGIFLPDTYDAYVKLLGKKQAFVNAINDVGAEAVAVLELCEALSCSNVGTDIHQKEPDQSVSERRNRDGKLPIYETKMLILNVPCKTSKHGDVYGAQRADVRQHLRRGHIRRLQDGRKIWVNSCVVGSDANGVINKSYSVDA